MQGAGKWNEINVKGTGKTGIAKERAENKDKGKSRKVTS